MSLPAEEQLFECPYCLYIDSDEETYNGHMWGHQEERDAADEEWGLPGYDPQDFREDR